MSLVLTILFSPDLEPFSHIGEMLRKGHCHPKDFSRVKSGIIGRASDPVLTFSFDDQPDLSNHPGPSPSLILQALTMSNSNDGKLKQKSKGHNI